ncbi:transcription elongation factor SPT4 homolog 1-like isoform X3 [Andrographis paniculata]|uniref:transcription elongation factor SPT4 homolog 1-like isoform X3 n=1 Tax=Andrographis paniculata TaxID=175694 RepID=UPI0021E7B3B9|nr:transcription elongation factor SPT4 homolog 1-like isoform X3 [Andrographis paniculata]
MASQSELGFGKKPEVAEIPNSFGRELRACLRCRLVKTLDQFRISGCENCSVLNMKDDDERVAEATTINFAGDWSNTLHYLTNRGDLGGYHGDGSIEDLGCSLAPNR